MPLQPKPPTLPTVRELESLPPRGLYWVTMVPKGPNWRRIIIISSIVVFVLAAAGFSAFAAFAAFAADSSDSSSSTASVEITYESFDAIIDENTEPTIIDLNKEVDTSQQCENLCTGESTCVAYYYNIDTVSGIPECTTYSSIVLVDGLDDNNVYTIKYINGNPLVQPPTTS